MARGPKHFKMAELILDDAKKFMAEGLTDDTDDVALADLLANHAAMIGQAQVHAILALAAASAQNIRRHGAIDGGMADDWSEALGVPPQ